MEKIEDFLGQCPTDTGNRAKISQAGPRHSPGGPEMLQQGPLASRPDTGDLVQRVGADGGAALLAMAPDHKAMGFVAQALQIIENRTPGIEAEGFFAGHIKMLAAGIAVGALGNRGQRYILYPEIGKDLAG